MTAVKSRRFVGDVYWSQRRSCDLQQVCCSVGFVDITSRGCFMLSFNCFSVKVSFCWSKRKFLPCPESLLYTDYRVGGLNLRSVGLAGQSLAKICIFRSIGANASTRVRLEKSL